MIVSSNVDYPTGCQDDAPALSALALSYGIGCHLDACLGSFVMPFVTECGFKLKFPIFDFRLPGITSISCDPHKYGYAPKGTSVVMFRTKELRRGTIFSVPNWEGGLYSTTCMGGSRSGAAVIGCWASLLSIGK